MFIYLFFSVSAYSACVNWIAESEIPKALALQVGAGSKQCGDSDPCICFDGVNWRTAVWNSKTKRFSTDASKLTAESARKKAIKDREDEKSAKMQTLKAKVSAGQKLTEEERDEAIGVLLNGM